MSRFDEIVKLYKNKEGVEINDKGKQQSITINGKYYTRTSINTKPKLFNFLQKQIIFLYHFNFTNSNRMRHEHQ